MTTPLRGDFDASGLQLLVRNSKDAGQAHARPQIDASRYTYVGVSRARGDPAGAGDGLVTLSDRPPSCPA